MRIILTITIIIISVFSIFGQNKNTTKPSSVSTTKADALADLKKAIDKANQEWIEAWDKGDPTKTTALFADDGKFLQSSGKIIKGKKQLLEWQTAFMKGMGKGAKVGINTLNVWLDGDDTAYEVGKYRYDYLDEGKAAVAEGKYVVIWKKQKNGLWKIFMDMGVPNN